MRPFPVLALPVLLTGCVLPVTTSAPAESPGPAAPTLAVDHETLGADYLLPGASIEHDGSAHLWVVAFGGTFDGPTILHLTFDEPGGWHADDAPVQMDATALGLNQIGPVPSSVLVEADGTWTMYGGGRLPGDRPIIWRATAPGPNGPWTFHPEPILEPSADGWDSAIVDHPSVLATDDGYLMTYGGASLAQPNRNRIGAAHSANGIDWERSPVSLASAADGSALGPVACGIEARTMFEPELTVTDDGYRLHFGAILADEDDVMVIGVAESGDGITWTCAVDGPLVEPVEVVEGASLHSYLVQRGDVERILVEVLGTGSAHSDLWLVVP